MNKLMSNRFSSFLELADQLFWWNNTNNVWVTQMPHHSMCPINRYHMMKSLIDHDAFLHFRAAMMALLARQRMEMISVIRLSIDLTHAVSTLPSGWFWGGKLKTWHVGALGTLSAIIGIYQYFAKKQLKKN